VCYRMAYGHGKRRPEMWATTIASAKENGGGILTVLQCVLMNLWLPYTPQPRAN